MNGRHLLARIALSAAVIVAMTGCAGSASTPSSSGTVTTSPSVIASPSSAIAGPSLPPILSSHADPELEALLPAEVSGTALVRYSIALYDLLATGDDRTAIDAFLQSIGKPASDATFAAALDPTNTVTGGVSAIMVDGADAAALLAAIVSVERSNLGEAVTTQQVTVGGKSVTSLSVAPEGTGRTETEWIYGRDDVVFIVHAEDETHAATFLQALP